jgi:uncharacterized protein (TIGR02001 family)
VNVKKHLFALGLVAAMSAPAMAADDVLPPSDTSPFSITGSAALTTEYFFRGFSQSNDSPSVSAGLNANYKITDWMTATAGVWAASVDSGTANGDVELDYIASLAIVPPMLPDLTVTPGVIWYTYPGSNNTNGTVATANEPDFFETSLGATYNFGLFALTGTWNYSPDFNLNSGTGNYINAKVVVPLGYIDLSGSIGKQYIEKNGTWGGPDYKDYKIAAAAKVWGLDLELAWIDTSVSARQQRNTPNFADNQFLFTVTKNF